MRPFSIKTPEEQLAEELRRCVRAGEWGARLPGQRALMSRFGVPRPLLEKSLARLVASGDLTGGGARTAYEVVRRTPAEAGAGSALVYSFSVEQYSNDGLRLLESLLAAMPEPQVRIRVEPGVPPSEVVERVRAAGVRQVLLANFAVQSADALMEAGLRVIVIGGVGVPVSAPVLTTDYVALLGGALRKAFDAGHRRVSVPLWRRNPGLVSLARTIVAEEYTRAGLRHSPEFDAPWVSDPEPAAMQRCIFELCRLTPPTALILHDFPQWMAVNSVLARLRLRVPEDMSTIMLMRAPELRAVCVSQAHMHFDGDRFVPELRRLLARLDRGESPPPVLIAPCWADGESLGRPA